MAPRMRDFFTGVLYLTVAVLIVLFGLWVIATLSHVYWMRWFWPGWFVVLVIIAGFLFIALLMSTSWLFWIGVALIALLAILDGANVPHFNWFVIPEPHEQTQTAYVCQDDNGNTVSFIHTKDDCISYLKTVSHVAAPPQAATQAPQQSTANATTQVASNPTSTCKVDDLGMTSGSGTNRYEVGGNGPQLWEYEPVVITNGKPKTLPAVWFITPAMAPDAAHPHIDGAAAHVWQADPASDCSNFDWSGFASNNADSSMTNSGVMIDARSNPPSVMSYGSMSQQDVDQIVSQLGQALGQP